MTRYRWLTPDTAPADFICRRLFIPNQTDWIAIVAGCLNELIYAGNFEQFGTATPDDTASVFAVMFDKFSFEGPSCKMIGEIILWSGTSAPSDTRLLLCDGSSVDSADYPDLYTLIGLTYGGTGPSDFFLPDLRGQVAIGQSGSHALGSTGGSETVTLSTGEMPSHTHTDVGHTHLDNNATPALGAALVGVPIPSAVPSVTVTGSGNANLTNTGGGGAHNNMQPFLTLNYYIVAE